jgi:hypothetical protein
LDEQEKGRGRPRPFVTDDRYDGSTTLATVPARDPKCVCRTWDLEPVVATELVASIIR